MPEVLVLTHELASIDETMPYHAVALAPMPVVEFWGRARALPPQCSRETSVFHWWKEYFIVCLCVGVIKE